jgi:hypothetical protein
MKKEQNGHGEQISSQRQTRRQVLMPTSIFPVSRAFVATAHQNANISTV